VLGGAGDRPRGFIARLSGVVLVAATVLTVQTALGLVFDPRYHDFPYAQLSASVVPFAITIMLGAARGGRRGRAETVAAATLAGCACYIVLNEGFANWQALWYGGLLMVLAVTLDRQRDQPRDVRSTG
jgi:peptidoglycan/LPS O-acetylase OafA/YrhL